MRLEPRSAREEIGALQIARDPVEMSAVRESMDDLDERKWAKKALPIAPPAAAIRVGRSGGAASVPSTQVSLVPPPGWN